MAQIVTITNPLTGQPAQVDQLEHTAQQIDDGIGFESTDYPGCYYRTVDGVVEWFNPPMQLGKEYRTTERWNRKPVYKVALETGALTIPGNTSVNGTWNINCTVIGVDACIQKADGSVSSLPSFEDASILHARFWTRVAGEFVVKSYTGLPSGSSVRAEIRYIKN